MKIYKLVHPKMGVVYIGRKKKTLRRRFQGDFNEDVMAIKHECTIELIEETEQKDREKYWIRQKEYREKNREKIKEYAKNQKFTCRCGSTCRLQTRKRHNKTLKHQQGYAHFILLNKNEEK